MKCLVFGGRVDIHAGDLEKPRSSLAAALAGVDGVPRVLGRRAVSLDRCADENADAFQ